MEKASIWFELPFIVDLPIVERREFTWVDGKKQNITVKIRNDMVKYYEADFFDSQKSWDEFVRQPKSMTALKLNILNSREQITTLRKFSALKAKDDGKSYHGVIGKTYIEVRLKSSPHHLPPRDFMFAFLIPWFNEIINAYRVSVPPSQRYLIDTLSEANLSSCLISFKKGSILWSYSVVGSSKRISKNSRPHASLKYYKKARKTMSEEELTFSMSFPLYFQGRYKEALLVAYSACESMTKEVVTAAIIKKGLKPAIWGNFKGRSDDIFKVLFPTLGLDDISVTNRPLWEALLKAREARGLSAHSAERKVGPEDVKRHLETFYNFARWLISQSNGKVKCWNMDIESNASGVKIEAQFD